MTTQRENRTPGLAWAVWCVVALIAFALSAAYFIYRTPGEDGAGLSGWLPWVFLALCPLMHFLMHHGHGKADKRDALGGNGAIDER